MGYVPPHREIPGLEYAAREEAEGWSASLTDDSGEVVWQRSGYKTESAVRRIALLWAKRHYPEVQATSAQYKRKPKSKPTETELLAQDLLRKADLSESRAAGLREQADKLELEAKKLRSAAEVLGG